MSVIESDGAVLRADFLLGFAAIHEAMRRDARQLPDAVATADRERARALAAWYALYRRAIEHHHSREDDVLWPALIERSPGFASDCKVLEADHAMLDTALDDVTRALSALVEGTMERAEVANAAVRLRDLLVDHLAREEATAFPQLSTVYTAEEWEGIERQFMKGMTLRDLAFAAPWTFEALPADDRRDMIASAPWFLRVLNRLVFTPWYRRVSAAVG